MLVGPFVGGPAGHGPALVAWGRGRRGARALTGEMVQDCAPTVVAADVRLRRPRGCTLGKHGGLVVDTIVPAQGLIAGTVAPVQAQRVGPHGIAIVAHEHNVIVEGHVEPAICRLAVGTPEKGIRPWGRHVVAQGYTHCLAPVLAFWRGMRVICLVQEAEHTRVVGRPRLCTTATKKDGVLCLPGMGWL